MRKLAAVSAVLCLSSMFWLAIDTAAPSHAQVRAQPSGCSLALILAIDVSGSIDPIEYALQTEGLANALMSPEVSAALTAVGAGRVFINVIQWSGASQQAQVVPWTQLNGPQSLAAIAKRILEHPRQFDKYATAIGEALTFAKIRFSELQLGCARRVLDVSGDGRSNEGWSPHLIRDQLVQAGVTVNGLVILDGKPALFEYYQKNVIGGAGSFAMTTETFAGYYEAIKNKLVREMHPPTAQLPHREQPPWIHMIR